MALTVLVATQGKVAAQAPTAPIDVGTLNHVSIGVGDVQRSVDFYQGLFGLTVKSRQGTADNVSAGGNTTVVVNLAPASVLPARCSLNRDRNPPRRGIIAAFSPP